VLSGPSSQRPSLSDPQRRQDTQAECFKPIVRLQRAALLIRIAKVECRQRAQPHTCKLPQPVRREGNRGADLQLREAREALKHQPEVAGAHSAGYFQRVAAP
jgi:hypothetical protein